MENRVFAGQLGYLFSPKSVAVIGASSTPGKWGFNVFNRALRTSSDIRIYPINPTAPEVLGVKAYKRVTDVPELVDLAVVVIPPQAVPTAMEECVEKGVKAAVIISAGFRETGQQRAESEQRVTNIARRGGIRLRRVSKGVLWHSSPKAGTLVDTFLGGEPKEESVLASMSAVGMKPTYTLKTMLSTLPRTRRPR